jgi:DNA mismatch repair protein MutL
MEALLERRDDFAPLPLRGGSDKKTDGASAAEPEPSYGMTEMRDGIAGPRVRLIGRAFNLFIIVERGDKLYLIDQHAAHERILYDRFLSGPVTAQELLVPVPFNTASDDDDIFLKTKKEALARLGITLETEGGGAWRIEALPADWKGGDPVEEILSLQKAGKDLAERWAAACACQGAIKDGGCLDDGAALVLAEAVLAIADETGQLPRCPHGRPLWAELSRDDLFRSVRRLE